MKTLLLFLLFSLSYSFSNAQTSCNNEVLIFDANSDQVILNSPISGNPDFTIEFWFRPNPSASQSIRKYFKWENPAGGSDFFSVTQFGDQLQFADHQFNASAAWIRPFSSINIRDGQWHHFAMTKNGDNVTFILDDLSHSYVTNITSTYNLPSTIRLGRTSEFVSTSIDASMDEVRIWNYARTNTQIHDFRYTELFGNEAGLLTYYKFSKGEPNQDNTDINDVCDWSGNDNNGSLVSFSMIGNASNFVTSNLEITVLQNTCDDLECGPSLPSECYVNTIPISTGVDHLNNQAYPVGQQINYWSLVDIPPPSVAPTANINLPYKPYTINPNPAWGNFPNSSWISAFDTNELDENNRAPLPPYSYQTCFCVAEDNSNVLFDFQFLADDVVTVLLTDTQGNTIQNFGTAKFKQSEVEEVNTTINLDAGTYCIRGDVRNTNRHAMGFNLEGTISGASFIDYGCCEGEGSTITGQKFHDKNCDGEFSSYELAMGLSGWEIQLIDPSNGQVIETQFTDDLGFYYFRNLPAGNYAISEVNQNNWDQTLPLNNYYQVDLGTFDVQGGFHFGNKYEGPIETENVNASCVGQNGRVELNWIGQDCDCDLEIIAKSCIDAGPDVLLGAIENTGSFTIRSESLDGEYSFFIRDCDGNEIPFEGCVTFNNYEASINIQQVGCGEYDFSFLTEGFELIDIQSVDWTFDVEGTSSNNTETISFETASTYTITLDLVTNDGCQVRDRIQLEVAQGANDPDCNFCPPEVLSEIEHGDLYIYDECYGMIIKSPNGSCYRIKVSDEGLLYAQGIECP